MPQNQIHWVLLPWKWNLDQRDKEIGHDGLPFQLSTCATTRNASFPSALDLFLRIPLSPEVPDSLLVNSLLLKFINLPPDNCEKATDNKLLGRKWHNEKDCDWHLEKGRPRFESQFYHSTAGYP